MLSAEVIGNLGNDPEMKYGKSRGNCGPGWKWSPTTWSS